ncbi:MAG: RDD family protein [Saprospiraceae bacterium]|nr:RDD family protein [Saprospiraceae bacterium]
MKKIEILTSHNIVISHELASLGQRIFAFVIDAGILAIYSGLISAISGGNQALLYIGIGLVLIFYHLTWEVFNQGQSPGKKILNIRVVSLEGITPSLMTYMTRWAFRLLDISLTLGSMAILSILLSPKGQRVGDLLGRSTVIQLKPYRHITLNEIQQLGQRQIDIQHPQIRQYSDQDMLLVKQTLQRFQKDPNAANEQMISDLAEQICHDLGISMNGQKPAVFLNKVLSEYILLTR